MKAGHPSRIFVGKLPHFDIPNRDFAAGIVLLEGKISLLKGLVKVKILVEFVAIDRDLDACNRPVAPYIIADVQVISEPRIRRGQSFVDMAHAVKRPRTNRIGMRTVDLHLVTVGKTWLAGRSKLEARVSFVVNFDLCVITKILIGPLGTNQHRGRT